MPLNTTTEAGRCPRCEQPNECVLARDGSASSEICWCQRESFPLGLIEASSGQDRGRRCICLSCVRAWHCAHVEELDRDERGASPRPERPRPDRVAPPDARPNEADELHDADQTHD